MKTLATIFAAATLLLSLGASFPASADEDLPVAPESLVYCTVCHGVQLMGNPNIAAPRLSGLSEWYIKQQLIAFKSGWRGTHGDDVVGMEMQPMAAVLTDDEIEEAAAFAAATRSEPPAATVEGDVTAGGRFYAPCAACHGYNGEGNENLRAPALAGLDDWYLIRQLENYKSGIRGSHPEDMYGQQMRALMATLPNEQAIRDVVSYITTLKPDND